MKVSTTAQAAQIAEVAEKYQISPYALEALLKVVDAPKVGWFGSATHAKQELISQAVGVLADHLDAQKQELAQKAKDEAASQHTKHLAASVAKAMDSGDKHLDPALFRQGLAAITNQHVSTGKGGSFFSFPDVDRLLESTRSMTSEHAAKALYNLAEAFAHVGTLRPGGGVNLPMHYPAHFEQMVTKVATEIGNLPKNPTAEIPRQEVANLLTHRLAQDLGLQSRIVDFFCNGQRLTDEQKSKILDATSAAYPG